MPTISELKAKLIDAGVKNLKEFGYPACNKDNILTDYLFSRFFLSMLKENKGVNKIVDQAIDELIAVCEANKLPFLEAAPKKSPEKLPKKSPKKPAKKSKQG